ncbi:hypothetical protein C2U70_21895 [Bradyrhizobium guangdongense]|uniref:hypothetical protein n=1 Tax=Bradyrhizobium guangdongense TaxID=1325090 RepID=UPI00112CC83C|nr:hypothetical protein [Bradyrhizobium guangdongense]TPQ32377.1 hypothetical protein C2U70_21895 [Bradyrhizobium guangdongense]
MIATARTVSVRIPLLACLATSALALALAGFVMPMSDFPSGLEFTVLPLLAVAFPVCGLWSLFLLTRIRTGGAKFALPFVVCVATLTALAYVPFTPIWLNTNFWWHRAVREQIVARVEAGELIPNVAHNGRLIALKPDAADVSAGGEIVVDEDDDGAYVLFLTSRGFRHTFSGFLHVPAGGDPAKFFEFDDAPPREAIRYGERWYFVRN